MVAIKETCASHAGSKVHDVDSFRDQSCLFCEGSIVVLYVSSCNIVGSKASMITQVFLETQQFR